MPPAQPHEMIGEEKYKNTALGLIVEDTSTLNTVDFNFSYYYEEYITAFDVKFAGEVFRESDCIALDTSTLLGDNFNRDLSVQTSPQELLLLSGIKTLLELTVMTETLIFSELTVLLQGWALWQPNHKSVERAWK